VRLLQTAGVALLAAGIHGSGAAVMWRF